MLAQEAAGMRVVFLTFIGAGLELIPAIPFIANASSFVKGYTAVSPISDPTLIILGFALFPVAYGLSTTLAFRPKRLVSPTHIQSLAVTLATIVFAISLFMPPLPLQPITSSTAVQGLELWFLFAVLLVFTGMVQTAGVRLIVGLNGNQEDIVSEVYRINAGFETVAQVMQRDDFLDLGGFRAVKGSGDSLLLRSSYKLSPGDKMVFTLKSAAEPDSTVLTTLAYEVRFYTIAPPSSLLYRDSIVITLENLLKSVNSSIRVERGRIEEASPSALKYALSVTRPSLAGIGPIPKYHLFTLIFAALVASIMTAAFYFHSIGIELYVSSLILILVEFAFVFGPALRDTVSKSPAA